MAEENRKLAAIMSADVVGYSHLMAADEAATVKTLQDYRAAIAGVVERHKGRVVNAPGDNILADFPSAVEAVECASEIQQILKGRNLELTADRRMEFRIGINLGDVIEETDGSIYGDGVNIAARMEAMAETGGICVSNTIFDAVEGKLDFGFEYLGAQQVKNIDRPITVYRVRTKSGGARETVRDAGPGRRRTSIIALAAVIVVVAVGVVGTLTWQLTGTPEVEIAAIAPVVELDTRRLAVLPFVNLGAEAENEYFSDGMTEELIAKLSKIRTLTVIARTSVMQYKGTVKGVAEIGQDLRVGTILEGSVRKAGDQLRITAQLIDVASEGHLWSETYDRPYADVFAVQSDVAQQVAKALQVALQVGEVERLETPGTDDLVAYDLYLQGMFHWNQMTGKGLEAGREFFKRAIERDPSFAQAHAGLAQAYELLGSFGYLPANQAFPEAQAAAEAALALDDKIAEAHTELALIKTFLQFDWPAAERGYRRALEVNPNSAYAHDVYGILYLTPHRRHEEAIAELRRSVELDPLSVLSHQDLAWVLYFAGRWDEAQAEFRKVLEMEPEFANTYRGLGVLYAEMEQFEPAIEAFRKAVEFSGESAGQLSALGWGYGVAGRREAAVGVLEQLRAMAEQGFVDPLDFAMVHIGLGNKDEALEWLEKAYEGGAGSWRLVFLNVFMVWDPLRSDPRFAELVDEIGLGD
jgi:adenylate cyclase